jgi:hypothetical protein
MDTTTNIWTMIEQQITATERAIVEMKQLVADAVVEGDNPKTALHLRELADLHDTAAALHRLMAS